MGLTLTSRLRFFREARDSTKALRMGHDISRRDFLNGAALTVASALTPFEQLEAQALRHGPYPPALAGLRGSTDEAYAVIHALARNGRSYDIDKLEADERYDLVVIGAGIAGLSAAWAYRERQPTARILILDNHDDFGGHARRCEFRVGNRLLLSYGGSESMVAPGIKYAGELARILRALRIYPERFERESVFHRRLYPGLGLSRSVFFDRETFGEDRLVAGDPLVLGFDEFAPNNPGGRPVEAFLADCPLSPDARRGLAELFAGTRDYLAGQTTDAKIAALAKTSYRAFLTDICKLPTQAADFFQGRSADNYGYGIDVIGAIDAMAGGFPGAKAMRVEEQAGGHGEENAPYIHHFPDGNASLARALARSLVVGAAPGRTMEDLVSTVFDYSLLDRPGAPVRIRLRSTAVAVRNTSDGRAVDIGYVKDGELHRVRAASAVVATYASAMPYICPEIDQGRADLLKSNVKAPLVYTKVLVRNWQSFVRLGTHNISAPTSFHTTVKLDYPVSLGGYKFPRRPRDPMVLHLVHVPLAPGGGHDMRKQARLGRNRLLGTTFADFERAIRQDLDRMLGRGGFSAERDILAITVNRWSHGYSYTPNSLYDDVEEMQASIGAARAKLGNIVFANSDTAWDAYAHAAMEEAVRAVGELLGAAPVEVRQPWYTRFLKRFSKS
jgi:spermidine dehydrogenase